MSRQLRQCRAAMRRATSYPQWLAAAQEHDHLTGGEVWRSADACREYDSGLLRKDLQRMRRLRAEGRLVELVHLLQESLHRHLNDLHAPSLYDRALSGTKHLVREYLGEAERSMTCLADTAVPGFPPAAKLSEFERAYHTFGRSALLLSGGATLGFYHVGVVKALFDTGLLPDVISGASMGAMIAASVCTRDDDELQALFADPTQVERVGLAWAGVRRALRNRAVLDPDRLLATIRSNMGADLSFGEAHAHSGRVLNISLSPTRSRQKPRVLNYVTAPNVLVAGAALASSALPAIFPPVALSARGPGGGEVPYLPTERWIDGSFGGDLPMLRLGRLHNVNHFIVSQTNPHVLPFARKAGGGVAGFTAGMLGSAVKAQGVMAMGLARRVVDAGPLRMLHAVATQDYRGDITIYPRVSPAQFRKMMTNPTLADLEHYIIEGERATWPRIPMIRDQTRIARTFERCVASLRSRVRTRARDVETPPTT